MGDIVNHFEWRWAKHSVKAASYQQGHNVAVGESEVGGCSHCGDVVFTRAGVGGQKAEHFSSLGHFGPPGSYSHIFIGDFVAESTRAGVYHYNNLVFEKAESFR
ncbi:hypothetical protein ES703_52624 [subsurface metagenome]